MASNRYRVPVKQWRKWDAQSREIFNELYRLMTKNPELFTSPKAAKQPRAHWRFTAWNAAWIAAGLGALTD